MPQDQDGDELPDTFTPLREVLGMEGFVPAPLPSGQGEFGSLAPSRAVLAVTPENFICLRGPCKHLWSTVTPADVEEIPGYHVMRATSRVCLVSTPPTTLVDEAVWECTQWVPIDSLVREKRMKDRIEHAPREHRIHLGKKGSEDHADITHDDRS